MFGTKVTVGPVLDLSAGAFGRSILFCQRHSLVCSLCVAKLGLDADFPLATSSVII